MAKHPAIAVAQALWAEKMPVQAVQHLHGALKIRGNYVPTREVIYHDERVSAQHPLLVSSALKLARMGIDAAPPIRKVDLSGNKRGDKPFSGANFEILALFGNKNDLARLQKLAENPYYWRWKHRAEFAMANIRKRVAGITKN